MSIKHMFLMRKRNVSQRRLFNTQKLMFNNKKNNKNNHFRGYIFYVVPLIESFDASILISSSQGLRIYEILYDNIKHVIPEVRPF